MVSIEDRKKKVFRLPLSRAPLRRAIPHCYATKPGVSTMAKTTRMAVIASLNGAG
jgi:hypothetical protein